MLQTEDSFKCCPICDDEVTLVYGFEHCHEKHHFCHDCMLAVMWGSAQCPIDRLTDNNVRWSDEDGAPEILSIGDFYRQTSDEILWTFIGEHKSELLSSVLIVSEQVKVLQKLYTKNEEVVAHLIEVLKDHKTLNTTLKADMWNKYLGEIQTFIKDECQCENFDVQKTHDLHNELVDLYNRCLRYVDNDDIRLILSNLIEALSLLDSIAIFDIDHYRMDHKGFKYSNNVRNLCNFFIKYLDSQKSLLIKNGKYVANIHKLFITFD